jgi:hypothetical protein
MRWLSFADGTALWEGCSQPHTATHILAAPANAIAAPPLMLRLHVAAAAIPAQVPSPTEALPAPTETPSQPQARPQATTGPQATAKPQAHSSSSPDTQACSAKA